MKHPFCLADKTRRQCGESARAALLLVQSLRGLVRKCAAALVLKAELLVQDTSTPPYFERFCAFVKVDVAAQCRKDP